MIQIALLTQRVNDKAHKSRVLSNNKGNFFKEITTLKKDTDLKTIGQPFKKNKDLRTWSIFQELHGTNSIKKYYRKTECH